jgi:hypothetical protein
MCKGYNYIGNHYDILGRNIGINDKKYGYTKNPDEREKSLTSTKSPIQYMIIKLYEFESTEIAKTVEQIILQSLSNRQTHGEWFLDNDETLIDFVQSMHNKLRSLGTKIVEKDLEKSPNLTDVEKQQLESLDRKQLNKEFFTSLKVEMDNKCDIFKKISPTTDPWIRKSYKRQGYTLVQSGTYARYELFIDGGDKEENEEMFHKLKEKKEFIEKELGYELNWEVLEDGKASRISHSIDGNIYDKNQWPKMINFMVENMPNFHKIMCKFIDQVSN